MAYSIFLAVPGVNYCWGTVTGVVKSTKTHTAIPRTGGVGFSGVEDFNVLWTEAHNLYERGEITHFAMLHGDITPDPAVHWLDVLLEEMDARQAALVSVVSPIKDGRGLTSTGIADLDDPWMPFRRFTMREVLGRLPPTFNAEMAGYPDRPLLHNTGLWCCDMRRPEFNRSVNGELDLYFGFPTRAVRGTDGAWMHQRESEDWLFSKDLWLRGVRDTYVTTRVRLTHHGRMDFHTFSAWGTFADGDENTANKWRAELEKRAFYPLQIIDFELHPQCNLGKIHPDCPNTHPERFANLDTNRLLDDDTIVRCAVEAYTDLGFSGLIGWHYYNEPTLDEDRMFGLMERIKAAAPAARFLLWTNGTLIPEACDRYSQFEQIIVSEYNEHSRRGCDRLTEKGISARIIENADFDNRLVTIDAGDDSSPCLRPFVELIVDAYGNTHLCCYDWRGNGTLGNVHTTDWKAIATQWRETLPNIAGQCMTEAAPGVCRTCSHRWDKYQSHDNAIVARARKMREAWQ